MKQQFLFCLLTALLLVPHLSASNLPWAVTATAFKLVDGKDVNNVKLNWAAREDADTYRVYRNGELLKEVRTVTLDDYDLPVGESFTYYVEAVKGGMVVATSEAQQAETFTPTGSTRVYDNLNGKYLTSASTEEPQGMKIDDVYYIYRMECVMKPKNGRNVRHWTMTESFSSTGLKGSWSQPRVLATYSDVNFEGNGFRYNPNTGKVVFSSHYEDSVGYTAAKIFLAQITPKGGVEVGTQERPLGYDSRDQSLFIDEDNTAYLLSATRMNNDINIYRLDETWTKPVELVNTIYKGLHRETPAILKRDGEYYCFSSMASGWYPSQTVCISASSLDGEWSAVQEVGNNSTFDAQFNGIDPQILQVGDLLLDPPESSLRLHVPGHLGKAPHMQQIENGFRQRRHRGPVLSPVISLCADASHQSGIHALPPLLIPVDNGCVGICNDFISGIKIVPEFPARKPLRLQTVDIAHLFSPVKRQTNGRASPFQV